MAAGLGAHVFVAYVEVTQQPASFHVQPLGQRVRLHVQRQRRDIQGTGRRKNAVARVRLVPGTGKVTINKRDAEQYFGRHQLVENALAPFKVTDTAGQFDVIALCDGGGISGQSGALRLGIARALLNAGDYRADLKKAGFLTRDARVVERKKYGLKKARRAPQFSKR